MQPETRVLVLAGRPVLPCSQTKGSMGLIQVRCKDGSTIKLHRVLGFWSVKGHYHPDDGWRSDGMQVFIEEAEAIFWMRVAQCGGVA